MLKSLLAAAALAGAAQASTMPLSVQVDQTSGAYTINVGGVNWFSSNMYAIRSNGQLLSSTNGGLKVDYVKGISGSNGPLGAYTGTEVSWSSGLYVTRFKVYAELSQGAGGEGSAIVFEQNFPSGLTGTALGANTAAGNDLSTAFPVLTGPLSSLKSNLAYVTWSGCMSPGHFDLWTSNGVDTGDFGLEGGVTTLYNASNAAVTISVADNFMVASPRFGASMGNVFASGFNGRLASIPAGTTLSTIMVSGASINNTMYDWGTQLLALGGKQRTAVNADFQTNYLTYWTDNGAYYYYNTESGKNYEQTMLDVNTYLTSKLGLPIRAFQYDSWWYFKVGGNTGKGALLLWEPMPEIFPDGMTNWFQNMPLALHNRYFAPVNNYSADYTFITEPTASLALPVDQAMFEHIMGKAKAWGMTMYEQDWLITVYEGMNVTQANISAAATWLQSMNGAAASLNLTIQLCMPLINHMLESTRMSAVTNARASGDYHPGTDQFAIGLSSLFYWAIGVQPSKDDFWTTQYQPGNPYSDNPNEPNYQLQVIITTLSTGPVGPSDAVGSTDPALLMQCCRHGDGLVLKADRPAINMDSTFLAAFAAQHVALRESVAVQAAPGSDQEVDLFDRDAIMARAARKKLGGLTIQEVYHTYSLQAGMRWHYLLAISLPGPFTVNWADLGPALGGVSSYAVIDWFNPGAANPPLLTPAAPFVVPHGQGQPNAPAAAHSIRYYVLAPVLSNGWILLGEIHKVATMSAQRSSGMSVTANGFSLQVSTAAGETAVTYAAIAPNTNGVVMTVNCNVSGGASATLTCSGTTCSCQ